MWRNRIRVGTLMISYESVGEEEGRVQQEGMGKIENMKKRKRMWVR